MSKDHQKATHSVDSVTVAHDAYSSYVAAAGVSAGEEHDPIQTAVRNSIDHSFLLLRQLLGFTESLIRELWSSAVK